LGLTALGVARNWPPSWMIRELVIREEAMFEFISMQELCQHLFDRSALAEKAATILQAILEARSQSAMKGWMAL